MSNILVPVDFSINCYNALRYGIKLAEATGRNLIVAHYSVDLFYHVTEYDESEDASFRRAYIKRLENFSNPANHLRDFDFEDIPRSVKVTYEYESVTVPVKRIVDRAHQKDVDLVVMGNRASPIKGTKWYGSTSLRVSSLCERPVFLIPPKAVFRKIDRIVVANAHEVADPYALWQIEGISELYNASVHFVHVDEPGTMAAVRFKPWRLMSELTDKWPEPSYNFTIASVANHDISGGLLKYAGEIDAKLLIMINRLEDQIGKLVYESLTQDVAIRSSLPLLILHTEHKYPLVQST